MARPELLLFDVNETLLDLAALRPAFTALLGSTEPMGEWFARMLHGSLVANHVNRYRPFDVIGVEALLALARRRGAAVTAEDAAALVGTMRRLPAHPEVASALEALRTDGFRLVALTNGSEDTVRAQLAGAGIDRFFERALSVDTVRRFKPAPETYLHAAAVLGVEVDAAVMIAAHDWDVIGARSVGMPGAFVARPTAVWSLPDAPPDLVAPDLDLLARLLAAMS